MSSTPFKINDASSSPYMSLPVDDAFLSFAPPSTAGAASSTPSSFQHRHPHDLVDYDDLPEWNKDNEYVRTGYRQADRLSTMECLSTVFRLHNETINIWSHMLGAASFVALTGWCARQVTLQAGGTALDRCAFIPFFIGVVGCLGLSTSYHTMSCKDEGTAAKWMCADYMGIVLLIWGSNLTISHFLFRGALLVQLAYTVAITVLSLSVAVVMVFPRFGAPKYRKFRAGLFVLLGLFGVAPAVQYGMSTDFGRNPWPLFLLVIEGALYIFGAFLFAARVPERFTHPGRCLHRCCPSLSFDIFGHSHQLFHLLVVGGAVVHYYNCYELFVWRVAGGGGSGGGNATNNGSNATTVYQRVGGG